jgi:Mitochondrial K+-H+ exchange-related
VKVYLLLIDHERFFFYSDESEHSHETGDGDGSPGRSRSGLRGWLHGQYLKFKSAWQHADSGAMLWMRRTWDWLHSLAHPDEAMLVRMRSARTIELHHPMSRSGEEVRAIWRDYLSQQWRRHLIWLSINTMIAPVALVALWPLPGPNLIGYWFAYRAIHHALVVVGIRRVSRAAIPTELFPLAALDLPVDRDDAGKARHIALDGAAARLDDHVTWHQLARRAPRTGQLAVGPTRPSPAKPGPKTPETGDHAAPEL